MKTIEVVIDSKGQTTVQTKGFTGTECRLASQFVEEALGQRTAEQLTAEFYQGQQTNQNLRQSN
jgi:hypothetical protein